MYVKRNNYRNESNFRANEERKFETHPRSQSVGLIRTATCLTAKLLATFSSSLASSDCFLFPRSWAIRYSRIRFGPARNTNIQFCWFGQIGLKCGGSTTSPKFLLYRPTQVICIAFHPNAKHGSKLKYATHRCPRALTPDGSST